MLEESTGAFALVIDKWNVSEPEKGHKLVEYAGRGLGIPDDPTEPAPVGSYVGKYEYMPDGSWKGAGTGTETFKGGGTTNYTWEEGSLLKENTYKYTGGTGKYEGVSGGGTTHYTKASVAAALHTKSAPSKAADTKKRPDERLKRGIHFLQLDGRRRVPNFLSPVENLWPEISPSPPLNPQDRLADQ